jgi:hypothetical protein
MIERNAALMSRLRAGLGALGVFAVSSLSSFFVPPAEIRDGAPAWAGALAPHLLEFYLGAAAFAFFALMRSIVSPPTARGPAVFAALGTVLTNLVSALLGSAGTLLAAGLSSIAAIAFLVPLWKPAEGALEADEEEDSAS